MARRTIKGRLILHIAAVLAATAPLAFLPSAALPQTLTNPNPQARWSPPQTPAKSHPAARAKSCGIYGAGFVNVPGTDTCIKVGGWVTVEGSVGR